MTELADLAELESEDPEFIPEILPVDARLSVKASVDVLRSLFARAAAVTPTREVVPGTSHALLEAFQATPTQDAYLRITASDGEQTISVVADEITVLMEGAVLVPPHRVLAILKLAPAKIAKLEIIGTAALIRSGRAQWNVQTLAGDSLAVPTEVGDVPMQTVSVGPFVNALSIARAAASSTSAWLGLNQLQIRNGTITGCDGSRLHRAVLEGLSPSVDLTIPVKVVDEALKALVDVQGVFELGWNDRLIVFKVGEDSIVAQRLREPFPKIENLLLAPQFSNTNTLTVERDELRAVIKRVRINADPDTAAIHLLLVPGKKDSQGEMSWSLAVRAKDRSGNGSQEVIECQWAGSERPRALVVNHHYLSAFLDAYKGETVIFKVGENTRSKPSPLLVEDPTLGFTGIVQQMHSTW